jgi:hypothetical protein
MNESSIIFSEQEEVEDAVGNKDTPGLLRIFRKRLERHIDAVIEEDSYSSVGKLMIFQNPQIPKIDLNGLQSISSCFICQKNFLINEKLAEVVSK